MKKHNLKILPEYFEAVARNEKTFEIRNNDRDYEVGDLVYLHEWNGTQYTGRYFVTTITYILEGGHFGLDENYCVFSIKLIGDIKYE